MSTGRTQHLLQPGLSMDLLPRDAFDRFAENQEQREKLVRRLRQAGVSPLEVRVTFGDGDAVVLADVGSLHQLVWDREPREFDFYSARFEPVGVEQG